MKRFLALLLFAGICSLSAQTTITKSSVVRGGQKGTTNANADITHTASGANHELVDTALYDANGNQLATSSNPVRVDPTGTTAQPVSQNGSWTMSISGTPTVSISGTATVSGSGNFNVVGTKTNNNAAPGATNVGVLPAIANAAAPSWTEGNQVGLSTDLAGNLRVTGSLSVGGTTDNSAFTAGTSSGTPAMGFYHSTIDTVTDGRSAALAIDSKRNLFEVIRDAAGNARGANVNSSNQLSVSVDNSPNVTDQHSNITADYDSGAGTQTMTMFGIALPASGGAVAGGTSSNPIQVSLANTGANSNKLLVTPDSVALPAHQSVNVDQVNGTTTDTNSGNKSAGTQRVVLATDQPALTNPMPVAQNAATSTSVTLQNAATASGNGTVLTVDGHSAAALTVNCSSCSGGTTVNFEISEDGSNWSSINAVQAGTNTIASSTTTSGVTVWEIPVGGFKQFRARISAYSAGTITVTGHADPVGYAPKVVNANIVANTATNQSTNVAQLAGTTTDTNSGNKSAGTLRVVLATDQPQPTNKFLVTPDANSSVNVNQVAGSSVSTAATGVQKVGVTGNAGAAFDAAGQNASSPANEILAGLQFNTTPTTITSGNMSPLQAGNSKGFLGTVTMDAAGNVRGANVNSSNQLSVSVDNANVSVNHAQVAGTTVDTNSGNKSAGTQRIVLATDQPTMTNAQPVTPQATESYLGFVGGKATLVSANFTRPADTTAYASGDLIANSTTAGSVTPMSFTASRINDASGMVRRAKLKKSTTSTTNATFRLHIYQNDPSASSGITNGDNGAWSTKEAGYLGSLTCDMTAGTGRAFSDAADAQCSVDNGVEINFKPASGTQTIYGLLEARGAYTPGNAEVFTVQLEVLQN